MNNNPDYCKATNAAYDTLCSYKGDFPNINVYEILLNIPNVTIHTYSEIAKIMNISPCEFYKNFASSNHGFTVRKTYSNGAKFIVYYNDKKDYTTIKFTLAHETGHIVLNHLIDNDIADKEANCFARNLICPVPVIDEYGIETVSDYMSCFDVSEPMAEAARANYDSDHYYITNENYMYVGNIAYSYISGFSMAEIYG